MESSKPRTVSAAGVFKFCAQSLSCELSVAAAQMWSTRVSSGAVPLLFALVHSRVDHRGETAVYPYVRGLHVEFLPRIASYFFILHAASVVSRLPDTRQPTSPR